MLINFVDTTNDANHYTKPPPYVSATNWCMLWSPLYVMISILHTYIEGST